MRILLRTYGQPPSAAAELVVPNIVEIKEYMNLAEKRLLNSINAKINILQQKLSLVETIISKYPLNPYMKQQYIDDSGAKIK